MNYILLTNFALITINYSVLPSILKGYWLSNEFTLMWKWSRDKAKMWYQAPTSQYVFTLDFGVVVCG